MIYLNGLDPNNDQSKKVLLREMKDIEKTIVEIKILNRDKEILKSGTGISYAVEAQRFENTTLCYPCIITCKHVVDSDDLRFYRFEIFDDVKRKRVECGLNDVKILTHPNLDLALIYFKNGKLLIPNSRSDLSPSYIKYNEDDKGEIVVKNHFILTSHWKFSRATKENSMFEYINIPGYHLGENNYVKTPIWVNGTLCSDPEKDYFVIQASLNNGSSGSPIFKFHQDSILQNSISGFLLGFISEAVVDNNNNKIGLSYSISSKNIEFLETLLFEEIKNDKR